MLTLSVFAITAHAQSVLTATVDRSQVSLEETLKLQVKFNEQVMFGEPDFSELEQNFDILGNSRSNQYRSINGKVESWTQWTLTLAPKREGKLLIPSFKYEGSFSDAIEITVTKTPAAASASDKPVYIEAELDKQQGYVQEQFLYTIRLFTSVDLNGLDRGELKIKNALVKPVSESQFQRTIKGVPYGVVETTYAIFPQQSGSLEIPSTIWTVSVQNRRGYSYDPFLRQGGQQLRLRTSPEVIQIDAKPGNYPADEWLPARNIQLTQSWSQSPDDFKVGEPITRSITIRAEGLMASQLPPLELQDLSDVKYYPDKPQSDESIASDGVTTTKTESYAIVPSQAGKITLPAITLHWWDTQAKQVREASVPAQTIIVTDPLAGQSPSESNLSEGSAFPDVAQDVQPTTTGGTSSLSGQPLSQDDRWFYISMALLVTNLMLLVLWLQARKPPSSTNPKPEPKKDQPSEKQAYKSLKSALQKQDPAAIRSALLIWARIYENDPSLSSLQQLAETLPPLAAPIRQIEAGIYGQNETQIDTESLQQALVDLRRNGYTPASANKASNLPPLYS
ncbi:BatD family protein [Aestuariicella sp. G3-2]|uniref:BatD family protein n=1 Tax=Pseudomaricurvus albidus TaxID=2842452 RepID=UPI001C0C696F|nr:BatD family protein [Aestuariicella albida]MBU3071218.1 BatD family protein [Aestuariicella albida]